MQKSLVKDILMIQQDGPEDYNKSTLTGFAANIFNSVQAKMVLDHITLAHAVSPPLHTCLCLQDW